jgi:phosphatidylinositol-3,4,5-trisphosphate 3-phosphatase/dual-specificity protein phosphatase PTEN
MVDLEFVSAKGKGALTPRCPLYENAYSAESMSGRVSRYPFPDHHAPPLSLLPLAVREMNAWLDADPERVAIIHCKAGKVRNSRRSS